MQSKSLIFTRNSRNQSYDIHPQINVDVYEHRELALAS